MTDPRIEAVAVALANRYTRGWEHMSEEGQAEFRRDAKAVLATADAVPYAPCCDGPHVRPCGPTGDDMYCACGCSGADERCWLPDPGDDNETTRGTIRD